MLLAFRVKSLVIVVVAIIAVIGGAFAYMGWGSDIRGEIVAEEVQQPTIEPTPEEEEDFIRWAQFDVGYDLLVKAYNLDVKSIGEAVRLNWIELLAYGVSRNYGNVGGNADNKKVAGHIDEAVGRLRGGKTMEEIVDGVKYYGFYYEVYSAILGGFLRDGELQVFSPIPKGRHFSHYDDFGNARGYGYQRRHMGNDLIGEVGTPIIAVERGVIEVMGWNQYGGHRIGIRSECGLRYWYYAHLREPRPFHGSLSEGMVIEAGEVIGYLGRSGYSATEGANNIATPHLHLGLQLIFDESQKEGVNQIWVNVYHIVRFLNKNRSEVVRDDATREWNRR